MSIFDCDRGQVYVNSTGQQTYPYQFAECCFPIKEVHGDFCNPTINKQNTSANKNITTMATIAEVMGKGDSSVLKPDTPTSLIYRHTDRPTWLTYLQSNYKPYRFTSRSVNCLWSISPNCGVIFSELWFVRHSVELRTVFHGLFHRHHWTVDCITSNCGLPTWLIYRHTDRPTWLSYLQSKYKPYRFTSRTVDYLYGLFHRTVLLYLENYGLSDIMTKYGLFSWSTTPSSLNWGLFH